MTWTTGHANTSGNEQVDEAANAGRLLPQDADIYLPSAQVAICGVCRREWSGTYHNTVPPGQTHRRATDRRCLEHQREWPIHNQVLLHQLRANRCPLPQATLFKWNRPGTASNLLLRQMGADRWIDARPIFALGSSTLVISLQCLNLQPAGALGESSSAIGE